LPYIPLYTGFRISFILLIKLTREPVKKKKTNRDERHHPTEQLSNPIPWNKLSL